MDFGQTWNHSGQYSISPDGRYLGVAYKSSLNIYDVQTLQNTFTFHFGFPIELVEWANNSTAVLCASFSKATVKTYSLNHPEWICTIAESPGCGLVHAKWTPDSLHVITVSDFQLRLSVWSLDSGIHIDFDWPKGSNKGISFSPNGEFMALATRHESEDEISIISCSSWEVFHNFKPNSLDLADLSWSPDGTSIALWDTVLQYKLMIHSPDGRQLASDTTYPVGLGIKKISWSPSGAFLAVGSISDQEIRVYQSLTWKCVARFKHSPHIQSKPDLSVFKEIEEASPLNALNEGTYAFPTSGRFVQTRYDLLAVSVSIPNTKSAPEKPNPRQGVGLLEWSFDGRYIFSRCDSMPNCLWIWDSVLSNLCAVLVQQQPIKVAVWSPVSCQLALCTGSGAVFFWSEDGASCVSLPQEFSSMAVFDIKWSPCGKFLVLGSKNLLCCAFLG